VAVEAAHAERIDNTALVTRTKACHEAIQALKVEGKGIETTMRELGLARETACGSTGPPTPKNCGQTPCRRPSVLDEFKPYLHQRWNAGCTSASTLFREITEQGYRGCRGTMAAYLAPFRALGAAPTPKPTMPKVPPISSWMLRHPKELDTDERPKLQQVLAACPHLDTTAAHVAAFAQMLTDRHSERLDEWMAAVDADDLPHLHPFVTGCAATTKRPQRTDPCPQLRLDRGQRQPHQEDQAPDVWPRQIRGPARDCSRIGVSGPTRRAEVRRDGR
jgi:hypothetical protein